MRQTVFYLRIFFLLAVMGIDHCNGEEDSTLTLDEIRDAWQVQLAEIQTTRITMRHCNGLAPDPADWAAVLKAVEDLDSAVSKDPAQALRAIGHCVRVVSGRSIPQEWLTLTIVADGNQAVRNLVERSGDKKAEWGYRNGSSVRHHPNFKSATIEEGQSQESRYKPDYVRPVPPRDVAWKILSSSDKTTSLEYDDNGIKTQIVIDLQSKTLLRSQTGEFGILIRGGLAEFSGGITIPTYGIDISMGRGGKVRSIKAFVVEFAEFNMPLTTDELAVVVPEGTRIIDKRDPAGIKVAVAVEQGDPVALAAELPMHLNPSPLEKPQKRSVSLLFMFNAILVVAGLVYLAVRGRARPSNG